MHKNLEAQNKKKANTELKSKHTFFFQTPNKKLLFSASH